jgi:hypothetical protein
MSMNPASPELHPSYLALDRYGLGASSPEVEAHVSACDECRGYVQSLRETPPTAGLMTVRGAIAKRSQRRARVWWTAGSLLTIAASWLLFVGRPAAPDIAGSPTYLGAKGVLSVWIYVKRGTTTQLWDGKLPIFSGDRLRIRLDPSNYRRVAVYSLESGEVPALLYEGEVVPGQNTTLPDAWEVDGEGESERLIVVLSNERIEPSWDKWLKGQVEASVKVLPFTLPKSRAPASDPSGSQ